MQADIAALSAPEFQGRQAGTEGDRRSAAWIGDRFRSIGLALATIADRLSGDQAPTGFMTSVVTAPVIDTDPVLRLGSAMSLHTIQLGTDYLPVLDSSSADVQAPIVFVGYGTGEEYGNVEVTNCIVLFLRGKPERATAALSHADKVRLARAKGAAGYLTATGPILGPYEIRRGVTGTPRAFYAQLPESETLPGAWISTQRAETIVSDLRERQAKLNTEPSPQSIRTEHYAGLHWQTHRREGLLINVVALLPGTGSEAIVIGAHRDHFGSTAGLVFPGADDNASGTAVMLEVARLLTSSGWRSKHTILFVSFSGEERDLLGSRLYVARPAMPLTRTKAMINIDHAGVGNGRLTVGVTGLDKTTAQAAGQPAGLPDKLDLFGFFPGGDHVPFKEAGVPTITVVSGGVHPHFHRPTDTADTIDPEILRNVARYVLALVWHLSDAP
ncbi:M28 family peptidase [Nitrospira moscoviensis]|nr:M28 family peptidase [Nitrospira moscoviensis]